MCAASSALPGSRSGSKRVRYLCNTLVLFGTLLLQPAWAATPPSPDIDTCVQIANDKERLACFDRVTAHRKDQLQSAAPTATTAATTQQAPRLSAEQSMGFTPGKIVKLQGASAGLAELTAKIQSVSTDPNGRTLFTLDNGQVWLQVEPDPTFRVQPGDTIHLTKATLGSYFLSAGVHTNTRVSRAR